MSSIDTLQDNLLRAVDVEYNVIKPENVLEIICQLEQMEITKEQLQTTRLGREINTIRQKINERKKCESSDLMIEIAQRAKKLLRSWTNLLNTCEDKKPRLILKVKLNSSLTKRKHDLHYDRINIKRTKIEINNNNLPRLKTTQEILLEMQMNQTDILSTQTSTINTILEKKILDESSQETIKFDYSTLHHEKILDHFHTNSNHYEKQLLLSSPVTSGLISKCHSSPSPSDTTINNNTDIPESLSSYRTITDHDIRESETKPDILLTPIEPLAVVYEREKTEESNPSITTIEKLHKTSDFIALPFIDCPIEFDLILDELIF